MDPQQLTGSPLVTDKRDVAEIFRERMRTLIEQRRENLSSFAKSVGIDRSALSQFMAADSTRLPRTETLHMIARTCGVSLDWLLGLVSLQQEAYGQAIPMLELQQTDRVSGQNLLNRWHKEATGYKIRYVPATLPDLLRTEAVNRVEFDSYTKDELALKERDVHEQLTYSRRPETDMEVCMPVQRIEGFAAGEGLWGDLSAADRREQLHHMAHLIDEMYPTFRLFLFDQRDKRVAPYTVFGPKLAAIYLGDLYLVVNSVEHIKQLARHFDMLIRMAKIGPDRVADFIRQLAGKV